MRTLRRVLLCVVFAVPGLAILGEEYWPFVRAYVRPAGQVGRAGATSRPRREWARPVNAPPLENLYRVSDRLYRGAQPDAAGMARLKATGVKTIVNLRRFHSDDDEAGALGLRRVHINVNPFKPTRQQLVEFLRLVQDPNAGPVYVHCQRGIDRTGMMCAVYRIAACGWPKEDAIDEMTNGPFGYDAIFRNVVDFLWRLDVEDLRRQCQARGRGNG